MPNMMQPSAALLVKLGSILGPRGCGVDQTDERSGYVADKAQCVPARNTKSKSKSG